MAYINLKKLKRNKATMNDYIKDFKALSDIEQTELISSNKKLKEFLSKKNYKI